MDIGCNINDAALLRNLAEDVPDMAASVRRRLRELADLIEAREASARPEVPALHEGMREVPCAVRDDGWLYIPHASGQWVTAAKLQPFSLAIIQHWKAEQRTRGVTPCPNAAHMGEHACANKAQCWEPCGELGNDERYVRVGREDTAAINKAVGVPVVQAPGNDGGKPLHDSAWLHACPKSTGEVLLPVWRACKNCGATVDGVKGPEHG